MASVIIDHTGFYKLTWPCRHVHEAVVYAAGDVYMGTIDLNAMGHVALCAGQEIEPCQHCGAEARTEWVDTATEPYGGRITPTDVRA